MAGSEPSMEEILASIRRIIAEEPSGARGEPAAKRPFMSAPQPPPPQTQPAVRAGFMSRETFLKSSAPGVAGAESPAGAAASMSANRELRSAFDLRANEGAAASLPPSGRSMPDQAERFVDPVGSALEGEAQRAPEAGIDRADAARTTDDEEVSPLSAPAKPADEGVGAQMAAQPIGGTSDAPPAPDTIAEIASAGDSDVPDADACAADEDASARAGDGSAASEEADVSADARAAVESAASRITQRTIDEQLSDLIGEQLKPDLSGESSRSEMAPSRGDGPFGLERLQFGEADTAKNTAAPSADPFEFDLGPSPFAARAAQVRAAAQTKMGLGAAKRETPVNGAPASEVWSPQFADQAKAEPGRVQTPSNARPSHDGIVGARGLGDHTQSEFAGSAEPAVRAQEPSRPIAKPASHVDISAPLFARFSGDEPPRAGGHAVNGAHAGDSVVTKSSVAQPAAAAPVTAAPSHHPIPPPPDFSARVTFEAPSVAATLGPIRKLGTPFSDVLSPMPVTPSRPHTAYEPAAEPAPSQPLAGEPHFMDAAARADAGAHDASRPSSNMLTPASDFHGALSDFDRSIEDTVADLLRPMLKSWLAENMPRIVERALRREMSERGDGKSARD